MAEPNGSGPDAPLKDVRVLDLTHFVAGPASTMALAFMGAEVIKVERPETESSMPPLNRLIVNPNKKSITLDLKSKAGFETVLARLGRNRNLITSSGHDDSQFMHMWHSSCRHFTPPCGESAPWQFTRHRLQSVHFA